MKTLFGMTGYQIEAMQGGKLRGAEQYTRERADDTIWQDHRRQQAQAANLRQSEEMDAVVAADARIAALAAAGLPVTQVLQAARELEQGDESLVMDLARICNIDLPKTQQH